MIFEHTITNHTWNGVIVPLCKARCVRVDIHDGMATTYTEYFSVSGENEFLLVMLNDVFPVDLDQPIRAQILAYFGAIFNKAQPQTSSLFGE